MDEDEIVEKLPVVDSFLHSELYRSIYNVNLELRFSFDHLQDASKCLNGSLTLNIDFFTTKLNLSVLIVDKRWFEHAVYEFMPYIVYTAKTLKNFELNTLIQDHWLKLWTWTHNEDMLQDCLKCIHSNEDEVSTLLQVLTVTAVLERSLGNLYLLKGNKVPSLLKHILQSEEIQSVIGQPLVRLLQIVIGPPFSMNLRNITWHGFAFPQEIHHCFGYLLLALMATVGEHLGNVHIGSVPMRSYADFHGLEDIKLCFPHLGEDSIAFMNDVLAKSPLVHRRMLPCWQVGIQKYLDESFGDCLALILPQLECLLRTLFIALNDCPHRLISAEASEFFTTYDQVLERYTDDGKYNKLFDFLGQNFMDMLLDIFVQPSGPRIRDRLSHGELDWNDIPSSVVNHILAIVSIFCGKISSLDAHKPPVIEVIRKKADDYEPMFHLASHIKRHLVKSWKLRLEIKIPKPVEVDENVRINKIVQTIGKFSEAVVSYFDIAVLSPSVNGSEQEWQFVDDFVAELRIVSHGYSKENLHVLSQLRISVVNMENCIQHVASASEYFQQQLNGRNLRSRQRATYARFVCSFPVVLRAIESLLLLICGYLKNAVIGGNTQQKDIMILKNVVDFSQKLSILVSPAKNKWIEAQECTEIKINIILKIILS